MSKRIQKNPTNERYVFFNYHLKFIVIIVFYYIIYSMSIDANSFQSLRFTKLLKRLHGRNYYHLLSEQDKENFDLFCKMKYHATANDKWRTIEDFKKEYKELMKEETLSESQDRALKILVNYIKELL